MRLFLFIFAMVVLFIVMNVGAGIIMMEMRDPDATLEASKMQMWLTLGIAYIVYFIIAFFATRRYIRGRS